MTQEYETTTGEQDSDNTPTRIRGGFIRASNLYDVETQTRLIVESYRGVATDE